MALSSCGDKQANPSSRREQSGAAAEADQKNHQWQQQFDAEHSLRLQVESRLHQQEAAKSWWQNAATLCALVAVTLLLSVPPLDPQPVMKAKNPPDTAPTLPPSTTVVPGNAQTPAIRRLLQPVALNVPQAERDLVLLSPVERVAEVLRFSLSRFEFWLSPSGSLRACVRLGLRVWCVLSIFSVLVAPVVTGLLTQTVTWTDLLGQAVHHLMLLPLGIGTFVLSAVGVLVVVRFLFRR